jgi:hypothetical protein
MHVPVATGKPSVGVSSGVSGNSLQLTRSGRFITFYFLIYVKVKAKVKVSNPCNRPWRPIGLLAHFLDVDSQMAVRLSGLCAGLVFP